VRVRFAAEDRDGVRADLAAEGLAPSLVERDAARWMRWDLAIAADAWNHAPLARCRRRIMFFHGVAGKYDLDDPRRLEAAGLHRIDRIAFINEDRMQRYLGHGTVRPEQAVLVGYPKGDDLLNGAWPPAQVRSELGLDPSIATILYAPTFSTASSLHLAGHEIVVALLGTGCNVIVKLHDRSMVPHPKHTGGIDWPGRLAAFEGHPRFVLARAADAGPFLSAADVLVTDHSTVGFEFALLDRPLIVFHAPGLAPAARVAQDKWDLLRSMADIVVTPADLPGAVQRALATPGRRRAERAGARALFAHAGGATERALAAVYDLLEIEPLRAAQADPPRRGPVPARGAHA
jgi:hypothetical protein